METAHGIVSTADKPVALISGANRGIGKETARQLAARGLTVLLGSRDPVQGRATAGELAAERLSVRPIRLDVTDPATAAVAAETVRRDFGRLDVLINNAGIQRDRSARHTTADEMRETFEVNVFGLVTLTRAMLPLLAAAAAPRVVNVSSTTASLALTSNGTDFGGDADRRMAYSTSKSAVNMLTVQYAKAFATDPELAHIKVNAATPGYTATDLTHHRGTRTVAEGAAIIVELATLAEDGPTGGFFNDQGPVPW